MDIFVYRDTTTGELHFYMERLAYSEMDFVGRSTLPMTVEWPMRPESEIETGLKTTQGS